jgi:hypothetical protein
MSHVLKNVGGIYYTTRSEGSSGEVYAPAPINLQREALAFFNTQLFTTPYWLMNKDVVDKVSEPAQPNFVEDLQVKVLNSLLDTRRINLLLANMRQFGPDRAYSADKYLSVIHQGIWKELYSSQPGAIDPYRRNLQKSYLGALQNILLSDRPEETETDTYSLLRADLVTLQREIVQALPRISDPMSKYHLEDLSVRIKKTLEAKLK